MQRTSQNGKLKKQPFAVFISLSFGLKVALITQWTVKQFHSKYQAKQNLRREERAPSSAFSKKSQPQFFLSVIQPAQFPVHKVLREVVEVCWMASVILSEVSAWLHRRCLQETSEYDCQGTECSPDHLSETAVERRVLQRCRQLRLLSPNAAALIKVSEQ